ncbi:MAG: histidine phosphatase family protein [Actinomycetota bacterium]|jgi:phosphohistidine phosphatase
MHRLFVLRHAKSSWNNAHLADFDRPLAPRGQRAAEAMAEHVAALEAPPALVLCSTARRARDTLEPLRDRLPPSTDVRLEDDLYGADAPDLLARLRQVPDDIPSVMIVGHNPGLEDLVRGLGRDGDTGLIARVHAKFPTAALATLSFDGPWKKLGSAGPVTLESFVVPGDLE